MGDFRGLFLDIVFNDILTMQRFLDISRVLYSGCWQVCCLVTTLETREDRSARRMTRISAAKIICIHNKLIKSQSPHKATYFRGQLFHLLDMFRFFDFLFSGGSLYCSSFDFVQSKRRVLHERFTRRKCFCYVIQRQTAFSLQNNPPSQRNCKLLCHNN